MIPHSIAADSAMPQGCSYHYYTATTTHEVTQVLLTHQQHHAFRIEDKTTFSSSFLITGEMAAKGEMSKDSVNSNLATRYLLSKAHKGSFMRRI